MSEDIIGGLTKTRIEALSDGIFATAMTIMVLTLVVPAITGSATNLQIDSGLIALLPNLLVYVISFFILGLIWIMHNNIFHYIRHVDRRFLWLNIAFLLCIGLLPFTTALIGRYPLNQVPVAIYGINLLAISITINLAWMYAAYNHRLINKDLDDRIIHLQTKRGIISVLAFPFAIVFAFVNVQTALAIYILVPLFYLIVGRLET